MQAMSREAEEGEPATMTAAAGAERAGLLLRALLVVPQGELDDTHFEKLQSRLITFTQGSAALVAAFLRAGAVETIRAGVKHEDFRVVSVCWRLLGKICTHSDTIFERIHDAHRDLFTELLAQAHSAEEPLVRDSTLRCLIDLTSWEPGLSWLNTHCEGVLEAMLMGYRSESHFVADSAVALFSSMIRNLGERLHFPVSFDVTQHLSDFLENSTESSELKKRTLNLMDALMRHEKGLELLKQHRLLGKALPLLFSPDRLVRANLLELLEDLLKEGKQHLLIGDEKDDEQAVKVMHDAFWSLFRSPDQEHSGDQRVKLRYRTNILTALELGAILASWRTEPGIQLTISLFREVASIIKGKPRTEMRALAEFTSNFHSVFVLKALHMSQALISRYVHYTAVLSETEWMIWLLQVIALHGHDEEGKPHGEDPRVIKLALEILQRFPMEQWYALLQAKDASLRSPGLSSILLLTRNATDRAVLMTSLNLLRHILTDDNIQHHLLRSKTLRDELSTTIRALANDWNWELRESVIAFVSCFFTMPASRKSEAHAFSYAIETGLPALVLEKLQDHESYVRAASLATLSNITQTSEGWNAIPRTTHEFVDLVITSLADTEAFVKRAALDLLTSWLHSGHALSILLDARDAETRTRLRPAMANAMQDFDWEVKLRGVRFLHLLLSIGVSPTAAVHGRKTTDNGFKRRRVEATARNEEEREYDLHRTAAINLFLDLEGDRLLIKALEDYERLVRLETARVLMEYTDAVALPGTDAVTGEEISDGERLALFWRTIKETDLKAIESEAGPRTEEEEDQYLTQHITSPPEEALDDHEEPPFLDCPF